MRSQPRLFVFNDPHPMRIDGALAKEIGLEESIVLLQLEYLISISDAPHHEGRRWTYQSLQGLHDGYFRWWSVSTIGRIIKSLENMGLITVANYNKKGYDRTRWYAINHDGISKLHSIAIYQNDKSIVQNDTSIVQSGDMEPTNLTNAFVNVERPIPETPTEITTENMRDAPTAPARPSRKRTPKQAATEPLFSDKTVPEEANGRGPAKGAHQALIDAYVQELGYTPAAMPAEAKAAKWLVENGYTPEQVVGCYRAMKRDAFWEKKHLSLMSLQKQIGAWLAAQRYQARPQQPEERPETPAERDAREARLYEEKYSKLRTVHPSYYRTPAS